MQQARLRPTAPAVYEKQGGVWRGTGYGEYAAQVRRAARALLSLGCKQGTHVAILGFNRVEWTTMDLAAMCIGGAPVGIYVTCSASEIRYIVHHSEARVLLIENEAQWKKIEKERHNMPLLAHVVTMHGFKVDDPIALSWDEFVAKGDAIDDALVDECIDALEPQQVATLIYTSGTTGPPKGVMLSHENLAWTASVARDVASATWNDRFLSYLPLSHIAEQVFTIHAPITIGAPVYFAESFDKVAANLKEVRPTIFFGVPRVWEKFAEGIEAKLESATPTAKKLAKWATSIANATNRYRLQSRMVPSALALQFRLAEKLVYSKVKAAVGLDRAHLLVSGAAPISRATLDTLAGFDIVVSEVYGQSEGTGPTTINKPGQVKFGTVGSPMPGLDLRLAEDGEICFKAPNVCLGYFKDPEATAETIVDGWLHSGDLGAFDNDGFLTITGRKKEILITAGGKNIAPKNIEESLTNHDLIQDAMVVGDRRKFLTVLVTLNDDAVEKFLAANGLERSRPSHELAEVQRAVEQAIEHANIELARVEQIKKFTILTRNFELERGELTPTMKIKRRVIADHFATEIEAMYAE